MALMAKGTLILVADAEKALMLENTGTPDAPELSVLARHEVPAEALAGATDRPGRMADKAPGQRSALEQADYARIAGEAFAAELAGVVEAEAATRAAPRLVIAAPAQVLGAMRPHLGAVARRALVAQCPKTLTGHTLPQIARIVAAELDAA
ncbi:baeRF12 domain-containing protein [Frigidibacter sp. MR17.24]|uniref:baeRF12 domain-containing protein n=1 Tax=Frigidibacter sp. MR17.24 TaxID=3127345 RepID=UPI003012EB4F